MTRIIQRREDGEMEKKDPTDTTRIRQMHEDMRNCLEVASHMVQASYKRASAALEQRDEEMQRLQERIDELESVVARLRSAAQREDVVAYS